MSFPTAFSDEKLIDICVQFLINRTGSLTAEKCNELWEEQESTTRINQKQVYPALAKAIERKFLRLTPPLHTELPRSLAERYGYVESDIKVVEARNDLGVIADATARVTLKLIEILGKKRSKRKRIHIGLGAGYTTKLVAQALAAEMRMADALPRLTFHAISSGFDVTRPSRAPVSFFSFFEGLGRDIEYVGLFAPAAVKSRHYDEIKQQPGVREAFEQKDDIDIVITSLASGLDPHGDLNRFLEIAEGSGRRPRSRVGDVQYRPYDAKGPLRQTTGPRAVTLFELDELREMAAMKDKHVVLVSGPCGICNKTRTEALRPLMENPKLKVWSHLVLDLDTARELNA